jgi:hypothetical protein
MKRFIYAGGALVAAVGLTTALVVVVPTLSAGATTKATAKCKTLFGNDTLQSLSGCSKTGGTSTITADALSKVNSDDTGATIYWTNGKTTVETFTYSSPATDTCPSDASGAQGEEITESAKVTGGTAGLTKGTVSAKTDVCVWTDNTDVGNGFIIANKKGSDLDL